MYNTDSTSDTSSSEPLLFNAVTDSLQVSGRESLTDQRIQRQYARRWYMLVVVALLNLSNGMIWMTFSSIADSTCSYYDVHPMAVNWLSIVFMIATVVLGMVAMWMLDSRGLRSCLLVGAWLNGIGAGGRIISTLPISNEYRYVILLISQTLSGCAQPFVMFAPTKLASQWFDESQRTFANMAGSTANPIGIMLGSILSTVIVPNSEKMNNIPLLLEVFAAPAFLGIVMTTFGVCSSAPPTPPSSSAAEICEPFMSSIKKLIHNRPYWMLTVCFGAGMGLLSTFVTLLDQLLCVHGYSDSFAGICCVLLFGVGLVGATIISLIVDRTHQFELVAKVCFALAGCIMIALMIVSRYPNMKIVISMLCASLGFFGLALNPICLELSVECTYPIAEGTASGILILSGQIQAAVFTFLMTIGVDVGASQAELCRHGDIIKTNAVVGFLVVTGLMSILFIVGFRTTYHRLHAEEQTRRTIQEHSQT